MSERPAEIHLEDPNRIVETVNKLDQAVLVDSTTFTNIWTQIAKHTVVTHDLDLATKGYDNLIIYGSLDTMEAVPVIIVCR